MAAAELPATYDDRPGNPHEEQSKRDGASRLAQEVGVDGTCLVTTLRQETLDLARLHTVREPVQLADDEDALPILHLSGDLMKHDGAAAGLTTGRCAMPPPAYAIQQPAEPDDP